MANSLPLVTRRHAGLLWVRKADRKDVIFWICYQESLVVQRVKRGWFRNWWRVLRHRHSLGVSSNLRSAMSMAAKSVKGRAAQRRARGETGPVSQAKQVKMMTMEARRLEHRVKRLETRLIDSGNDSLRYHITHAAANLRQAREALSFAEDVA